jgi:hypothetical protein
MEIPIFEGPFPFVLVIWYSAPAPTTGLQTPRNIDDAPPPIIPPICAETVTAAPASIAAAHIAPIHIFAACLEIRIVWHPAKEIRAARVPTNPNPFGQAALGCIRFRMTGATNLPAPRNEALRNAYS